MATRYPKIGKQWRSEGELESVLRTRILNHFAHHRGSVPEQYICCHVCYCGHHNCDMIVDRIIHNLIYLDVLRRCGDHDEFLELIKEATKL